MKNINPDDGVRTRLILAALDELCDHGISDFSLRRVAAIAQVSCAAPYRHFKSKEELITETAKYITSKWSLLTGTIVTAHKDDPQKILVELSVAAVRFWIANGNFRSLLIPDSGSAIATEMKAFDTPILRYASAVSDLKKLSDAERTALGQRILSLIYGNVILASAGKLTADEASDFVRSEILSIL